MMVYEEAGEPGKPGRGFVAEASDNDVRLLLAIGFSVLFAVTIFAAIGFTLWPGRDAKATWKS